MDLKSICGQEFIQFMVCIQKHNYNSSNFPAMEKYLTLLLLDSERSDECINFTMMYFFCVSVYTMTCQNNASI